MTGAKKWLSINPLSLPSLARAWTKFKNSFVRLTGMTKQIFHSNNFLGSGHFLVHFLRSHGSKNDRSQKSYLNEKSVFSCPSTSRRNFWILLMLWLYFHGWILKLYEVISKLCDLGGHSYLDKKYSPCLGLPPLWCTKLCVKSGLTLFDMSFYNIFSSKKSNFICLHLNTSSWIWLLYYTMWWSLKTCAKN